VLFVAAATTALVFIAGTIYTQSVSSHIGHETRQALNNGVPSVERLVAARSALTRLDGALRHAVIARDEGFPFDHGEIQRHRLEVRRSLLEYLDLPFYEGEQQLYAVADARVAELEDALSDTLAMFGRDGQLRALHEAVERVGRLIEEAQNALGDIIDFDVRQVAQHAVRIQEAWRSALWWDILLSAVGLMSALLSTLLAARVVRRNVRRQTVRAEELEMFAGRVAHDLLSPLTSVGLALEVAATSTPEGRARNLIDRGAATLQRVRRLVDGLLDFARSGARPDRSARAVVPDVVEAVAADLGPEAEAAQIELAIAEVPSVSVACPDGVLTAILSNFVRNAIKFMSGEPRRIEIRVRPKKGAVCIEVEDSGPGLAAGIEGHVFEPYARGPEAKAPGLGLGLATVKRLSEAYGGSVGVLRASPHGAIFWSELPEAA
jgi:signal transduction histidine kinase